MRQIDIVDATADHVGRDVDVQVVCARDRFPSFIGNG